MKFRSYLSTVSVVIALVSCGKSDDSIIKHDDGHLVRSKVSANWIEIDRHTLLTQVLEKTEADALPDNSYTTRRIQYWIDKIDAYARSRDPQAFENVPYPRAVVLKDASANAFVPGTPVCYNVPVTFGNGNALAPKGVYFDRELNALDTDIPDDLSCIDVSPSDLPAVAAEYKARHLSCDFELTTRGIRFSDSCETLDPKYSRGLRTNRLLMIKIPNWFIVLSGISTLIENEKSFVGVLAHELGHYYRSHSNSFKGEYDFYYTQNADGNHDHKPVPDLSLEEFGNKVYLASAISDGVSSIEQGDKYKVNPLFFLALGDIARQASSLKGCKVAASFDRGQRGAALGLMPFVAPLEMGVYDQFLAAAQVCLEEIQAAGVSSRVDVLLAISAPEWAPVRNNPKVKDLAPFDSALAVFQALGSGLKLNSNDIKVALFDEAKSQIAANIRDAGTVLAQAYVSRLGQYTAEQEADDISAEVLSNLGIGGNAAVDAYMSFVDAKPSLFGFVIGKARCEQLRANGWVDPTGEFKIPVIPVGNYSEDHHSSCYRVFNASRELTAHGYSAEGSIVFDGAVWHGIQSELAPYNKSATDVAGPGFRLKKFTKVVKNCPFEPKSR